MIRDAVPSDLEDIRELFREYEDFLDFDLCFQSFEEELAGLPGRYAPPRGCLRGSGLGRALCETLIDRARILNYRSMKLDTVSKLKAAIALYKALGFEPCEPYCENPQSDVEYFELFLEQD